MWKRGRQLQAGQLEFYQRRRLPRLHRTERQVGIDRDYNSLRQDLWIATDQAFKEAVETYSRKQAYLSSLARQSDIDDFSKVEPVQLIEPLQAPDWTSRNWDHEAARTSATLRAFSEIHESRVTYYILYATSISSLAKARKSARIVIFCRDRSRHEYICRRRRAPDHFYDQIPIAPGRFAERRRRAQRIERCRHRTHGCASRASGAGLHWPRPFRGPCRGVRAGAGAWDRR